MVKIVTLEQSSHTGWTKKRVFSKNENRHGGGFLTKNKKVSIGYIETFLFHWSWGFFPKKPPPRPIFVFENTRVPPLDLKKYFFSNRLKSFFYQSHWIAFVLTIPKWYNTWVLKIFLNVFSEKIFLKIFEKYF